MVQSEKSASGVNGPGQSMSDIEAQEAFQYRRVAAQEHYRIYDNLGRCWLWAYLVPLGVLVGGYVWWLIGHAWIHQHVCGSDLAYSVVTLVAAASAAAAFGLASLCRAEFHADRAFQPLVCGWLAMLLLFVWWKIL